MQRGGDFLPGIWENTWIIARIFGNGTFDTQERYHWIAGPVGMHSEMFRENNGRYNLFFIHLFNQSLNIKFKASNNLNLKQRIVATIDNIQGHFWYCVI